MADGALVEVPDGPAADAVPMKTLQLLLNSFITDTVQFLNSFSSAAEGKLQGVSSNIARLEKNLILLESKLARISGLTDLAPEEISAPASTAASSGTAAQGGHEPAATPAPGAGQEGGAEVANAPATTPAPAPATTAIPPEYAKYKRLLDMGMPGENLAMKMQAEGFDPAVIGIGAEAAPAPTPAPPQTVPPEYVKYQKLLNMGMPAEQIMMKMTAEGCDPAVLGLGAPAAAPAPSPTVASAEIPPEYAPFQKLLKLGMPPQQVALKMSSQGCDPAVLGLSV